MSIDMALLTIRHKLCINSKDQNRAKADGALAKLEIIYGN